jgi:hypothetical protein
VARKPPNASWLGFTQDQAKLLDLLDHLGNNGWSRNGQTESLMPTMLGDLEQAGLSLVQVSDAMESIGYGKNALHQLERWESKRTTGKFGR